MALDLTAEYPGQLDPGDPTGYPYGEARNITVPGDGTGFPLEREWVNDLLGFEQALLDAAGLTPSGTPDKVGASQYLEALLAVIEDHVFAELDAVIANFTGGVTATGPFIATGTVVLGDNTFVVAIGSQAVFGQLATFNNGLTVAAGALVANGNVTLGNASSDAVTVHGQPSFLGTSSFNAPAIFNSPATFDGTAAFNDDVEVSEPVTLANNGHIRQKVIVAADADTDYSVNEATEIHITALTAPRTYGLLTTGANDGSQITIVTYETTHVATVNGVLMLDQSPGDPRVVTWTFRNGAWRLQHVSVS